MIKVVEGQAGMKDGLHSFDLANWLLVMPFRACGCHQLTARGETSSP